MEPFIGQVVYFAGNFAPRGWAFCEGQLLAISQNSALFSIIGTTYGGDGRTTFGLPDLRGRAPVSPGTGPGLPTVSWGQRFGHPTTQLTVANLPNHAHGFSVTASSVTGNTTDPTGAVLADSGQFDNEFNSAPTDQDKVQMAPDNTLAVGSNQAFSNEPPRLGVYAIIAMQGTFPSRS